MSAVISDCGRYRYRLTRQIGMDRNGTCCFIMLNPSTADAIADDPTIRRCINYAAKFECDQLEVVNLFAYRSTIPDALYAMSRDTVVGPENDRHIINAAGLAHIVICAWGNHGSLHGRDKEVLRLLRDKSVKPMCLKVNGKSQQPAHPLYLKNDAMPIEVPHAPIA